MLDFPELETPYVVGLTGKAFSPTAHARSRAFQKAALAASGLATLTVSLTHIRKLLKGELVLGGKPTIVQYERD